MTRKAFWIALGVLALLVGGAAAAFSGSGTSSVRSAAATDQAGTSDTAVNQPGATVESSTRGSSSGTDTTSSSTTSSSSSTTTTVSSSTTTAPATTVAPPTTAAPATTAPPPPPPTTAPPPPPPTTTAPPPPPPSGPQNGSRNTGCEQYMYNQINAARANAGVPALAFDTGIQKIAVDWSDHMAGTQVLAHNPNYANQILQYRDYRTAGENVGRGYDQGSLFQAFMNSPGHRANIEKSSYTHVTLGCITDGNGQLWVTQNFWG